MITPEDPAPVDAEWRVIPVNNNYEISNYGQIRRLTAASNFRYPAGTPVIPKVKKNGYFSVALWIDGKATHHSVHRLMAITFLPNPENLPFVLHRDDVKANCFLGNLRWGSIEANTKDRAINGRTPRGERAGRAKMTAEQVIAIRADRSPQRDIADSYGITQSSVWAIKARKSWRHVADE